MLGRELLRPVAIFRREPELQDEPQNEEPVNEADQGEPEMDAAQVTRLFVGFRRKCVRGYLFFCRLRCRGGRRRRLSAGRWHAVLRRKGCGRLERVGGESWAEG